MRRLQLEDGSQWPDPQGSEIEWRCRFAHESISSADLFCIAEVLSAYKMLLHGEINAQKKLGMIRLAAKTTIEKGGG